MELVVHGSARHEVADRLVAALPDVRADAVRLMLLYLRPEFREDVFWLDVVEVFAEQTDDGEDAVHSFSYSPDEAPEAEGHTRFDVLVQIGATSREQAFRPVRFTVGFV